MSVYIYSNQRGGNGGPALNALGTIMLVMSFVIAILGYIGYRWLTRGERGSRLERADLDRRQRRLTPPVAQVAPPGLPTPRAGRPGPLPRGYQGCLVANMAQTTLPLGPGGVQPHSSHSDDTTCSPRPDSPNQHGLLGRRHLVAGIGDRAQQPRARLQQAEPDRPARPDRPGAGHRVPQRVRQQFGHHDHDVVALPVPDAPAAQRRGGEVPGHPDRLGTRAGRAGGHLGVAGPALGGGMPGQWPDAADLRGHLRGRREPAPVRRRGRPARETRRLPPSPPLRTLPTRRSPQRYSANVCNRILPCPRP